MQSSGLAFGGLLAKFRRLNGRRGSSHGERVRAPRACPFSLFSFPRFGSSSSLLVGTTAACLWTALNCPTTSSCRCLSAQ